MKFVGGNFCDSLVTYENWHPTKLTRYTVFVGCLLKHAGAYNWGEPERAPQ